CAISTTTPRTTCSSATGSSAITTAPRCSASWRTATASCRCGASWESPAFTSPTETSERDAARRTVAPLYDHVVVTRWSLFTARCPAPAHAVILTGGPVRAPHAQPRLGRRRRRPRPRLLHAPGAAAGASVPVDRLLGLPG